MAEIIEKDTKMTKVQIIDAYNRVVQKLNAMNSGSMNVEADIEEKKMQTIKAAVLGSSVQTTISDMLAQLTGFKTTVEEKFKTLTDLEELIASKKQELEDLFGIEKEALALATFIDTKKLLKAEFERDEAERKEKLSQELITKRIEIEKSIEDLTRQYDDMNRDLKTKYDRLSEEFKYNHSRDTKEAEDALNDKLSKIKKEFDTKLREEQDVLSERQKAVTERENEVQKASEAHEAMQKEIDGIPAKIEAAVKAAEGKCKGMMEAQFNNERKILALESAGEIANLKNKIEIMGERASELASANEELRKKLDSAYTEIKEMASKALDSASGKRELDSVMKYATSTETGKTSK